MTLEQEIEELKATQRRWDRSGQQMAQRLYQMTLACEAMQRIIRENGIDHPCLDVKFPIIDDYKNIPELHAYEQCQALKAGGLRRDWKSV